MGIGAGIAILGIWVGAGIAVAFAGATATVPAFMGATVATIFIAVYS